MSATAGDFVALIRQIVQQTQAQAHHEAIEGLVQPGSWDPAAGTIKVMVATTGTLQDDSDPDETTLYPDPVPVMTPHIGSQGAPIGLERVILLRYEGGLVALFKHDVDDSLHPLAGEHFTHLRSLDPAAAIASYLKVQHDATRIGHVLKTSVLSPIIVLGADQPGPGLGIMNQAMTAELKDAILQVVQEAINTLATRCQPGSGVPAPHIADVAVTASETSYSI
jgi:hypothetical protein